jgi:hypothetical protein
MIVLVCIGLGLALRFASGRHLADLGGVHLWGEGALLALLVVQLVLPSLTLTGAGARVAFLAWAATFPLTAGVAWVNRREPGMAMLGLGLILNFAAIASNGGMPVFASAAALAKPGIHALSIPATDFIHVLGTSASRLPWLGDVIPITGPAPVRSVVSAGDVLLFAGIIGFLGAAHGPVGRRPVVEKQESAA